MKNIKLILSVAVVLMAATSCVEKSEKYQALLSQRDSLLVVAQNYTQTLDIVNEVEAGFNSITELQAQMKPLVDGAEGQAPTKKRQLTMQVNQIKDILEQNKAKIAELQARQVRSGVKNTALNQTIERLESEMSAKITDIQSLQTELSKKNLKIEELSSVIESLNTDIIQLDGLSTTQQNTIADQDQELHKVWYVIGTMKTLKALQIVSGNGLFRAKTVMDKEFDKSAFSGIDLRQLVEVPTDSKNPKLLSSHPVESYELVKDDDKLVTIWIIDPAKFWSVSKYLVIRR